MRKIKSMHGHFVVCGFGRVGREIAHMFRARQRDFVVLDKSVEIINAAIADGCPALLGNAEHEDLLRSAGVERAVGLVAATTSDAINTYVTLTARALNPDIYIVARSEASASEDKLRLAGANRIISPYKMGARRMALSSLQPMMADFMDALAVGRHGDLLIAELEVEAQSALDGVTLLEAFKDNEETTVLGVRRADQSFLLGPRGADKLHAGDVVILMAAESDLSMVAERAKHA